MKADIRDRLRRLGVHKDAGHLKAVVPRGAGLRNREEVLGANNRPSSADLKFLVPDHESPLWNLELQSAYGRAFVRRTHYRLDHQHGGYALQRALGHAPHLLARLSNGVPVDLRDALFLDTETTGLAGGTGTLVFLVGLGYFSNIDMDRNIDGLAASDGRMKRGAETAPAGDSSIFVVDQFFLPDPIEEGGMLCMLDDCLNQHRALVTFNGRGFDVPLLETRFTLARMASSLSDHIHLDLLQPARRAWRIDLSSCSLSSLEFHMLGVRRDQQDIPGFLIPQLYREYLETHDPADMHRVMYHNLHDILSMVTLVSRLCSAMNAPGTLGEYLSAGQYYESAGQLGEAVETYRAALAGKADPNSQSYRRILYRLANCLKRQDRFEDALPYWLQLANSDDINAWLELAKYYEWHRVSLEQALACATRALTLSHDPVARAEISHRVERLQRKMSASPRS